VYKKTHTHTQTHNNKTTPQTLWRRRRRRRSWSGVVWGCGRSRLSHWTARATSTRGPVGGSRYRARSAEWGWPSGGPSAVATAAATVVQSPSRDRTVRVPSSVRPPSHSHSLTWHTHTHNYCTIIILSRIQPRAPSLDHAGEGSCCRRRRRDIA